MTPAAARAEAGITIQAPRERVWALLTDFPGMHRWFVGVRAVELDGPPKVGVERRVTFRGGLAHHETISEWTPPSHLALVVEKPSGLVAAGTRVDIDVAGSRDEARINWQIRFRLNLGRLPALLVRPVIQPIVGAALKMSLSRLRRLAESSRP